MKFLYPIVPVLLVLCGFALLIAGETERQEKKVFRLRPTHEQLRELQEADQAKRAKDDDPVVTRPAEKKERQGPDQSSLIKRSTILSSGRNWTIVPKRAVLHIPDRLKQRVDGPRSGKLIPWQTFYAQNRGWLHVHSVSMSEARGEQRIDAKKVEAYEGLGRVVVSVCHGGPISVFPPKEEPPSDKSEVAADSATPVSVR